MANCIDCMNGVCVMNCSPVLVWANGEPSHEEMAPGKPKEFEADTRVSAALIAAIEKRDALRLMLAAAERKVTELGALQDQINAQTDPAWAEKIARDALGPTDWEKACAWARGEA